MTKDDVLKALKKYVLPLFNPQSSVAVVVSAPGNVDDTAEGLRTLGFKVEKKEVEIDPEELDGTDSEDGSDSDGSSER